jgi:pilus assembly protein TadC
MNRALLLVSSPFAALLVAVLSLLLVPDPALPVALVLLPVASVVSVALGIRIESVPVKHNPLVARIALYLLALFNLAVISSIAIAVVALFVLFGLITPVLPPAVVWYMWGLPALLIALQTAVILERRINVPRPTLGRPLLITVAVITAFNVYLWTNALLVEYTNFLFFTGFRLVDTQAVYLLLTGATLQAVTAMITFRIPTLFEIVFFRRTGRITSLTTASPIIFTFAFTGFVFIGSLLFVLAADNLFNVGDFLPQSITVRLLLVFPAALVTFFVVAGLLSYQRSKAQYRMKMDAERKVAIALVISCVLVSLLLGASAWRLSQGEALSFFGIRLGSRAWVELLVGALLVITGPVGFFLQARQRRIRYTEERLSDFLRDLAETSKAGLPLHQSLQAAAQKDYGPLTKEIQKMSVQCSWGLSFAQAFQRFGERSPSRLVKRASNLVVETSVSGGNTSDILAAAAVDIHQQKSLDEDRRVAMSTYIAVIYIVFFVFLAVLGVLSVMFLPELLGATQAANEAGASNALFSSSRVNLRSIKDAYFQGLLVQAFGNGLIAGMISDGSVSSGMKHMFILILISYAAYRLLFI